MYVRPAIEFCLDKSERESYEISYKEENCKSKNNNIEEHMKTHGIQHMHRCEIFGKEENLKTDIERAY